MMADVCWFSVFLFHSQRVKCMAIHLAALKGQTEIVEYLVVTDKVDVNVKNRSGCTALQLAALEGHLEVVQWLIEKGKAKVTVKSSNEGLVGRHQDNALLLAVGGGHFKIVQWLLRNKIISVNQGGRHNKTAVHLAAQKGHLSIIKCLVEEGEASVNVGNGSLWTPLHSAASYGRLRVLKWLIEEQNMDVDTLDGDGQTALFAGRKHFDIVKYLVAANANPSALDLTLDVPPAHITFVVNFKKLMFLMGFHQRLGTKSSIRLYMGCSTIFESGLLAYIFQFYHQS